MGRKEENLKRAEALLHTKEFIRNIGTAAHIDHGKCVSGDARLWLNGRWIRAEDVWRRGGGEPQGPTGSAAEGRDVTSRSLWTRSIDVESGDVSFAQVTHAWRLRATEPLVEVETRDGRRVRTTREHKFAAAHGHRLEVRGAGGVEIRGLLAVAPP